MKSNVAKGLFIPTMQPSYADLSEVMAAHGTTSADLKYDGYRVQVHRQKDKYKIYTRNGNELNYQCYPEITKIVEKLPECLIEAELVGEGSSHKQVFDNVKKRFRRPGINDKSIEKYVGSGIIKQTPLSLRVFDTLYFQGKYLIDVPLFERRNYTEKFDSKGIQPSETKVVDSVEKLEALLDSTFKNKQEGRVCKNPNSIYLPGKSTIDWVKFKRFEPLDLVVVGFYNEKAYGMNLPFTSVLCATLNKETGKYETIGKIAATRKGIAHEIYSFVKDNIIRQKPANVIFSEKLSSRACKKFMPDKFINPENSVVLEVRAMNLNRSENWQSCGYKDGKAYSMRIGFAHQLRDDKNPKQATTTQIIEKLYKMQGDKDE